MPISNTTGTFSVGRDISIILIGPDGSRVDLPNIISFDAKQETVAIKIDRIDSVQMHAELPKGWTGSFELERGNSAVDLLFAGIEENWVISGIYNQGQLITNIIEKNGSISTFAYDNVSLKYAEAGTWKGDSSVRQKIEFNAWRRRPQ
jgi:hypothetical protein